MRIAGPVVVIAPLAAAFGRRWLAGTVTTASASLPVAGPALNTNTLPGHLGLGGVNPISTWEKTYA